MLVEGLQAFLVADAGVQSIIGTPSTRADKTTGIFPVLAVGTPTMPYVAFQQVSGAGDVIQMQGTDDLQVARWRFSCYGSTYKQAKQAAKYLRLALLSLDGPLPAGEAEVHGAWWVMEADDAEPLLHATIYATHVDFSFRFVDLDVS